jgi:hypothetical protein
MNLLSLFPDSYESSRNRFRSNLDKIRETWPSAELRDHRLRDQGGDTLTIDWIAAFALEEKSKLFVLTTGEHGVEGYVGSAMLELFIQEFLLRLEPKGTGILLVHAINPWGMKHKRRVNLNNVDLNRNFVLTPAEFNASFNPGYKKMESFLNPSRQIKTKLSSDKSFYLNFLFLLFSQGMNNTRASTLLGQYAFPQGLYYGGTEYQQETSVLMELYRQHFSQYDQILHLDMHTGYGPRYQMSLVNSIYDPVDSADYVSRFHYPLVVKTNPDEFYAMRGDMVDCEYQLMASEFPAKRFFATAFEFGTYGDSVWAAIRSSQAMIYENQLFWHGSGDQTLENHITRNFLELYFPSEAQWRQKAVSDARQAFEGILKAEGYWCSAGK